MFAQSMLLFMSEQWVRSLRRHLNMATVTILSKTRISCCLPSSYFLLPLLFCTCSGVSALQHGEHLYCYSKWLSPNFREYGRGKTGACCLLLHFHSLLCDVEYQLKLTLLRFFHLICSSHLQEQQNSYFYLSHYGLLNFFPVPHYSHSLWEERCSPISRRSSGSYKKWVLSIILGCFNLEQQTTYMWWQQVPF